MSSVCVVGLGKLGSCLAAVLASKGHEVIGLDVTQQTVDKINEGNAPVQEPDLEKLISANRENLKATINPADAVKHSSIAFIVVPTPSSFDGTFSNQYIFEAIKAMGPHVKKWYTFVICSTVMPGATNGPITAVLEEATGRKVGKSVGLCYSPEFIALGSVIHDMTHPDLVLLGADDNRSASDLYSILENVSEKDTTEFLRMSVVNAELAKISVNTYITMKISYANMMAEICEQLPGADAWKVLDAVGVDSRIGHKYLSPGGAYGGPCFPRDTAAFSALASQCGTVADLADATDAINRRQAIRVAEALKHFDRVAVLGKSYKRGTNVTERSFAGDIIELLQFEGVRVVGYDSLVHDDVFRTEIATSAQDAIKSCEAVVIAVDDPDFRDVDYSKVRIIVDVWGLLDPAPNVWKIGAPHRDYVS